MDFQSFIGNHHALVFLVIFSTLHFSSATCGIGLTQTLRDKIVGGRYAEEGEFPWQASFQKLTWLGFYHICGASLITPEWLVTAAHCIKSNSADSYRIMIGNNNLTTVTTDHVFLIQKIIIKQGFDPMTFNNDIALIRLFSPVPVSSSPICLPDAASGENSTAIVTGWGATVDGGKGSPQLQAADVIVISRSTCLSFYEELTDSMICAGYYEGGIDACQGDSGGPLMQWRDEQAFLIGIVSWGVGCAEPGLPGVYTDIIEFVPWIQSYTDSSD